MHFWNISPYCCGGLELSDCMPTDCQRQKSQVARTLVQSWLKRRRLLPVACSVTVECLRDACFASRNVNTRAHDPAHHPASQVWALPEGTMTCACQPSQRLRSSRNALPNPSSSILGPLLCAVAATAALAALPEGLPPQQRQRLHVILHTTARPPS